MCQDCFFCDATLYYLILPQLTTAYPVLPLSTPSYVVFYCQRTLASTPSCLILPHLTTSYPVVPSYPSLLRPTLHSSAILPRPTTGFFYHPTPSYLILSHPTTSYLVLHWILLPSYPVLPYPIPAYHILPRPGVGQGRLAEEARV